MFSMVKGSHVFAKLASKRNLKKLKPSRYIKLLPLAALTLTVMTEAIQRVSLFSAGYWIWLKPYYFFLNAFITLLILLLLNALTGSFRISMITSTLILVLLAVSTAVKKQLLGDQLFPWDFGRLDQVMNLVSSYQGEFSSLLVLLAIFIAFLFLAGIFILPEYKLSWKGRTAFFLITLLSFSGIILYRHIPVPKVFSGQETVNISWIETPKDVNYGFLLSFLLNIDNAAVYPPKGYSSAGIKQISDGNAPTVLSETDRKPDIIMILNESFWDPTLLPNVSFSADPLAFFHKTQTQYGDSRLVSPVFGGSTANVEFEALTGLSTSFLPQGTIPYQEYIKKPLPALPYLLQKNGYQTIALHPYQDWFYKRNTVYPNLGFQHFYSMKDFVNPEMKGEYISDLEVSKKIIQELSLESQESAPKFIFAVTMQNHGPYTVNRYQNLDLKAEGKLSKESLNILNTYVQGVSDADKALQYLLERLAKSSRPAIVVFFGDHLPYLGRDYKVYKETGYIQGNDNQWTLEERLKMRATPLLIWSNYEKRESGKQVLEDAGYISSSFLGTYLLAKAQLAGNYLFNFNRSLYRQMPVFNKAITIDSSNRLSDRLPDNLKTLCDQYWLLEYDLLFGEQYSWQNNDE